MKGNMKKVITLVMALVLVLSITSVLVSAAAAKKDIVKINGVWTYTVDGKANYSFTGFASNKNGTYYVEKGIVTFKTTSVIKGADGNWYNVVNSKVTTGETIAHNSNGWWYIGENGQVDFTYDGLAKNQNGTYFCSNGKVTFKSNGAWNEDGTWFAIVNSKISETFKGFANDLADDSNKTIYFIDGKKASSTTIIKNTVDGKWYGIKAGEVVKYKEGDFKQCGRPMLENVNGIYAIAPNGTVDFSYNGIGWGFIDDEEGIDLAAVKGGKFDSTVNGVVKVAYRGLGTTAWANFKNGVVQDEETIAHNSNGWWYINEDGFVDFSFTGLADNVNGTYYCENGKVKFDKTGAYTDKRYNQTVALSSSKVNWTFTGTLEDIETGKSVKFVEGFPSNVDGLRVDTDGKWKYFNNGKVVKGPFLATNQNGTYFVNSDGIIDFKFTGFYCVTANDLNTSRANYANYDGCKVGQIIYLENSKFRRNATTDIMSIDLTQVCNAKAIVEAIKTKYNITAESAATANFVVLSYVEDSIVAEITGKKIVLDAAGAAWLVDEASYGDFGYNTVALDKDATAEELSPVYFTGYATANGALDDGVPHYFENGKLAGGFTGFFYDEDGYIKYFNNGEFDETKTDIMDIDLTTVFSKAQLQDLANNFLTAEEIDADKTADIKKCDFTVKAYVEKGIVKRVESGTEIVKDAKGNAWLIEVAYDGENYFNTVAIDTYATKAAKAPVYITDCVIAEGEDYAENIYYFANGQFSTAFTGFWLDQEEGQVCYIENGIWNTKKTDIMDIKVKDIVPLEYYRYAMDWLADEDNAEIIEYYEAYLAPFGLDQASVLAMYDSLEIKAYVKNGVVYCDSDCYGDNYILVKDSAGTPWIIMSGRVSYGPLYVYGNIVMVDPTATYDALSPVYYNGVAYIEESYVPTYKDGCYYYFKDGKVDTSYTGLGADIQMFKLDENLIDLIEEEGISDRFELAATLGYVPYGDGDGELIYFVNGIQNTKYEGLEKFTLDMPTYTYNKDGSVKALIRDNDGYLVTEEKEFTFYVVDGAACSGFEVYRDGEHAYYVDLAALAYTIDVNYFDEDLDNQVAKLYTYEFLEDGPATGLYYDGKDAWYVDDGVVIYNEKPMYVDAKAINTVNDRYYANTNYPQNAYYIVNGKVDATFNGLFPDGMGRLAYYVNGAFDAEGTYTGLATTTIKVPTYDKDGYFVKKDGKVVTVDKEVTFYVTDGYAATRGVAYRDYADEEYQVVASTGVEAADGLFVDGGETWFVKNGIVDKNGLYAECNGVDKGIAAGTPWVAYTAPIGSTDTNGYYIVNGKVDTSFTGLYSHEMRKDDYTGYLVADDSDPDDLAYFKNGVMNDEFEGLVAYKTVAELNAKGEVVTASKTINYYVVNGYVDNSKTGLIKDQDSKIKYVKNGVYDNKTPGITFSGIDSYDDPDLGIIYYYMQNSDVNTGINGVVNKYYFKNGVQDIKFTGVATAATLGTDVCYYVVTGYVDAHGVAGADYTVIFEGNTYTVDYETGVAVLQID